MQWLYNDSIWFEYDLIIFQRSALWHAFSGNASRKKLKVGRTWRGCKLFKLLGQGTHYDFEKLVEKCLDELEVFHGQLAEIKTAECQGPAKNTPKHHPARLTSISQMPCRDIQEWRRWLAVCWRCEVPPWHIPGTWRFGDLAWDG